MWPVADRVVSAFLVTVASSRRKVSRIYVGSLSSRAFVSANSSGVCVLRISGPGFFGWDRKTGLSIRSENSVAVYFLPCLALIARDLAEQAAQSTLPISEDRRPGNLWRPSAGG